MTILNSRKDGHELKALETLRTALLNKTVADDELLANLGLFITRPELSSVLFIADLYKRIINVHGVIMEFGVRWGRNMALLNSCRGIFEPYNLSRRLIGFDTFEGFPHVSIEDGEGAHIAEGGYGVPTDHKEKLEHLLDAHAAFNSVSHIKRHELVKGDVCETLPHYLQQHPETVVAFAYFDMDLYTPTKTVLEMILPRMPKGAILGFDEVCFAPFPGETTALDEVVGLANIRLQRLPFSPYTSFFEIE